MYKKYLSKSDYFKGVRCEKILWLMKYRPDIIKTNEDNSVFETGRKVGELAKGLFGDYEDVPFNKNYDVMIEKTEKLLKDNPNIITEASFSYNNNFCRVDILKNDLDGVEIYEVKSSASVKDKHIADAAFQYFVLSNLGLNVKNVYIIYINNKYIRGKELEIEKLFNKENVTSRVKELQIEIGNNIEYLHNYMETNNTENEPYKLIGEQCCTPTCDFWDYCTRDLPKPNIFELKNIKNKTKFRKYYEGKITFEDMKNERVSDYCREQIDFEINDRDPKIEKEAINEILDSLDYPLYFIDYETCNFAIPQYEGTHAYQQIPFQYSLHIIPKEGATPQHKEFLAEVDDENIVRTFAESMIKNVPENGSVIVYNRTFEETLVNNKISEMYSDLKPEIDRINGNMVDFEDPFKNRNYYVKEMKGRSSIKYVLPALYPDDEKLNYDNLDSIHKGNEASAAFESLKYKTPEEQAKTRHDLLKYCELDTYAMVKIWEKFKEVTK